MLRHQAGFGEDEISTVMGTSVGTTRTHLLRGMNALRTHFGVDLEGSA